MLAVVSVPAAVAGSLVAGYAPDTALKFVLGIGLLAIASVFVRHHDPHAEDEAIALRVDVAEPSTHRTMVAADDRVYDYEVCRTGEGRTFAAIGGLLVGLISTGLGEAELLCPRQTVPHTGSSGGSDFGDGVAMTALAASVTHFVDFVAADDVPLDQILSIISFTILGVIIGGQLGPLVVARVPEQRLVRSLGWLFFLIAIVTMAEAVVG